MTPLPRSLGHSYPHKRNNPPNYVYRMKHLFTAVVDDSQDHAIFGARINLEEING